MNLNAAFTKVTLVFDEELGRFGYPDDRSRSNMSDKQQLSARGALKFHGNHRKRVTTRPLRRVQRASIGRRARLPVSEMGVLPSNSLIS